MRPEPDHCPRPTAYGRVSLFVLLCLTLAGFAVPASAQQSPHGKLKFQCEECHTSADWKQMTYPSKFKHAKTGFALKGQHESVKCTACHTTLKFAVAGKRCSDCHKDVHKAELGATCDRCHSPDSWVVPDMIQRHAKTRFSLVGAHAIASCESCHKDKAKHEYVGVRTDCFGCHGADFESTKSPNHRAAGFTTDCASCHLVNASRWGGSFDHARTGFPLTGAHASVACSQCHVGNRFKGTAAQCSGCHMTDFAAAKAPSHAGFSTECTTCHTMRAWQPATFDHVKVTGFAIVGAHQACTCQQCHVNNVFKGTANNCFGCHQTDFTTAKAPSHTGFSTTCETCHGRASAAWKPATFDHNTTAFPLMGAHSAVNCQQCHVNNVYNGTPTLCFTCHQTDFTAARTPLHTGFPTDCMTCHTMVAGWRPATFDHNRTAFPLTGSHVATPCASCHKNNVYRGTPTGCYSCHQSDLAAVTNPPHTGFSQDCSTCHSPTAWRPATFDHSKTLFPLVGAHTGVTCQQCHVNNVYKGTPTLCFTCHQSDFSTANAPTHTGFPTDCMTCHTMVAGWRPATFDHSRTAFPLTGSHMATPCASCHKNNVYKGTSTLCVNCHQSDLATATNPPHTGFPTDCATCHATSAWRPSTFDHGRTAFPLTGAHMAVACTQCHRNNVYAGTTTLCYACHTTDFANTTNPRHTGFPTDCKSCHTTAAWQPASFDHSRTNFPLTGSHMTTACSQCHINGVYAGTPNTCGSSTCHLAKYNATTNPKHTSAQFGTDCKTCHSTTAWVPSTFNHTTWFPIASGRHGPGTWTLCTECHTTVTDYKQFSCIQCHAHSNKTNVDNDHQGRNGYTYTPTSCYTCHPQGRS